MRNRALHDVLRAFAERASEHLTAALESGSEIPFEVAESPGATSILYQYRPLSDQFVRERFGELRALEGFGAAVLALARVEGVSGYLRVLGTRYVPALERDRAEAALREFLARLWAEVTAFELDDARFERVYAELESIAYEETVINTVLAPILGLCLADERWDLGSGLALVRGDLCEAPPEAVWSVGAQESEPSTLAVLAVEATPDEPPPLTAARLNFRRLLTALRLFKTGPASLGPIAWWRTDDGPWQSAPLGFPGRPHGADYWLERGEREDLVELFELVRSRPSRGGPMSWALARFEMGCERSDAIGGLSDHLLAMRALLDGDEPGPVSIALRLAALCADLPDRRKVQTGIEQAFSLERLVMRGDVGADYFEAVGSGSPDAVAHEVEEHLRALLRDMVCGHLEPDVKRVADELLLSEADERTPLPGRNLGGERSAGRRSAQGRGERPRTARKSEPALEHWEEVVPGTVPENAIAEPAEPQFVVRRTRVSGQERERGEQATEETVAAPVDEPPGESTTLDWGFDDDPSDYSAAV